MGLGGWGCAGELARLEEVKRRWGRMARKCLRPNETCLLSREGLWVSFRLEAGPGCSLLGVGTRSLSQVCLQICGDTEAQAKGLRWMP